MTPLTWNTDRSGNRSRVYGGWHNWLDQSGWRALDGGFREDSGRYIANQIPGLYSVPALATGSVEFEVNQRYDIFSKSQITDAPWSLEITPENVRPVAAQRDDNRPDQIVYPNAFADGIDLRYTVWIGRAPRVTREVVIRREPPGDHDIRGSWLVRSSNARVYVRSVDGQIQRPWTGNVTDAILGHSNELIIRSGTSPLNESLLRGTGVKAPSAWYYTPTGELVTTRIKLDITVVSVDTVQVTKIIPRAFVREAFAAGATAIMSDDTSTFYPDPNAEVTSVDGTCYRVTNGTWSSLHDGVGEGKNDNGASLPIQAIFVSTGEWSDLRRMGLLFDTSALTGETPTSATVGQTVSYNDFAVGSDGSLALCGFSPASNTALVNSDYSNFGTTRFCDTDIPDSSWTGTLTWAVNASGLAAVDVEGISKFGVILDFDLDDAEPSWSNGWKSSLTMKMAETSGTASDPYLEVTTGASFAIRHSGSGGGIGSGIGYGICDKIRG